MTGPFYIKSRYASNGRWKHVSVVTPYRTLEAAFARAKIMGGPSQYLAVFDWQGKKVDAFTEIEHMGDAR